MSSRKRKGWLPVVVILFLLFIWELSVRIFNIEAWLLPSPTAILKEGFTNYELFLPDLSSTIRLSLIGFFVGAFSGLSIAFLLHSSTKLKDALYPLIILSQNIPTIVLAPLLIIWFGFGILPKIIIIALVGFFPVVISTLDGLRQAPNEIIHYVKMAGASKSQIFWKVQLPYSLPSIFSGIKITATYAVMGAVISEWLGASSGIGLYMIEASNSYRTDRVFVAIFIIMSLSMLYFYIIQFIENKLVGWKTRGEKIS